MYCLIALIVLNYHITISIGDPYVHSINQYEQKDMVRCLC
jgi:hypothetical protein